MIKRKVTRQVSVGDVKIGGGASISIQSMVKVPTSNAVRVISQIKRLEAAGCQIVRVAIKTTKDAQALRNIKRGIKIPLVADIHFDYRLALAAIQNGADKIRINPGNMRRPEDVAAVVIAAKKARIPIRIGTNSGSAGSSDIVKPAVRYIKLFEGLGFRDIILSLKASDVLSTVEAYRKISALCDYPLHLGVTAAGPYDSGVVKSAIGIGSLLLGGIGDTIRVSLTADPAEEVAAAKRILSATGARKFGPDIISCPTCGRCQVDLGRIVREFERAIRNTRYAIRKSPISIAIMGCEVNGPGEAKDADIGIAFGKDFGALFMKGKIVKKVSVKNAVKGLLSLLNTQYSIRNT